MTIYWISSTLLTCAYAYIMTIYIREWRALPEVPLLKDHRPKTLISVIIPARNEEENIVACLQSILTQNYPTALFEIIVIDDHSTDQTGEKVKQLAAPNLQLYQLADYLKIPKEQAFKKRALEMGIQKAKGQLIVTTDADCLVSENWLLHFAAFYESTPLRFIAAPVNFHQEESVFEAFQSLDFMGMMGVSGAGLQGQFMYMCNGANLAYERKAFYEVDGFKGIDHLASGDDMLLMQKLARRYPGELGYLKNAQATTLTKAMPKWSDFLNQRIRWASKSGAYQDIKINLILALVFLFCWNILAGLVLLPFFGWPIFAALLFQLAVKSVFDYRFLGIMARFFKRQDLMRFFIPSQILHICYIALIGILANLKKQYHWKGRSTH